MEKENFEEFLRALKEFLDYMESEENEGDC